MSNKKPNNYWTYERCKKSAQNFNKIGDFNREFGSAYNAAHRNGWLSEITSHMKKAYRLHGYWTKENCCKEALKYNKRGLFAKYSSGAYDAAYKNGWLNEICKHMI